MGYRERAVACFKALAVGDAIGKQTETLSHADVLRWYPDGVSGFHGIPGDVIPRYAGNPRREWRIGETTDDTEQTLAVAKALLGNEGATHTAIGRELLKCKKSIHPGVKSIWTFHQLGDPARVASDGDGCGAAMRVAPVGVLYSTARLDELVRAAHQSAIPTHGGRLGICAAAAVAGAISAAIEGMSATEVLQVVIDASNDKRIAMSIQEMYADLWPLRATDIARKYFPDKSEIKVPLAISLALITQSAEQTTLLAANIGGDSDSVASIGSAIAGALRPDTVNEPWFRVVQSVNGDDLIGIAQAVAALRR